MNKMNRIGSIVAGIVRKRLGVMIALATLAGAISGSAAGLGTYVQPFSVGWGLDWNQDGLTPMPPSPIPFQDAFSSGADIDVRHADFQFYYPGFGLINGLEARGMVEFSVSALVSLGVGVKPSSDPSAAILTTELRIWPWSPSGNTNLNDPNDRKRFKVYLYEGDLPVGVSPNDFSPSVVYGGSDFDSADVSGSPVKLDLSTFINDVVYDLNFQGKSSLGLLFVFEPLPTIPPAPPEEIQEHLYLGNYQDTQPQLYIVQP
jgi:hypothetical protein